MYTIMFIFFKSTFYFDWIILSQSGAIYCKKSPINMFNYFSLFYSPNIWFWNKGRYQPFVGDDMVSLKHSGANIIDPTNVPMFSPDFIGEIFSSSMAKIEFGLIVSNFKVSYQLISSEIFGKGVSNSSLTYPLEAIQNLSIEWQFWN